ncbi:MAG: M55 family metallopeptidase [Pseudomonadota bacterium]
MPPPVSTLFICADMEGIAGVTGIAQTLVGGFEYEAARRWMTAEVAAVADAAQAAGAERVVVADSHANAQNLIIDELPRSVELVRGWPRPLAMMQGVETPNTFGAMLIGHHCSAQSAAGHLAHTFAGRLLTGVRINGEPASETDFNLLIARHFNVPVLMVSGDDAFIEHAKQAEPEARGVVTKAAFGRQSARMRHPDVVLDELKAATTEVVQQALGGPADVAPPLGDIDLELVFQRHKQPELLAYLRGVERVDGLTIRYRASDAVDMARFLSFVTHYELQND